MHENYMKDWETPPWNEPETIYWYISDKEDEKGKPRNVWGFDTYKVAQQYAELFGGHVEITRPDKQTDLFNF